MLLEGIVSASCRLYFLWEVDVKGIKHFAHVDIIYQELSLHRRPTLFLIFLLL